MSDQQPSAEQLFNFVCRDLPEDWRLVIDLEEGGASVELINPEGDVVNKFADDDGTLADMVWERVNYARNQDELTSVTWEGEPHVEF